MTFVLYQLGSFARFSALSIQFHGWARFVRNDASGYLSRKTTVSGVGASTDSTEPYVAWRLECTPAGGKMMWSYEAFTSFDVITLPSWNFTPLRTLNVYVRRSGEIVHDSARSPMIFVPVRSVGSVRSSVLYCGAPGCSIANVSSWWASKLGGSAATTKISSPPERGVSCATAALAIIETRASAVSRVFMGGIILTPHENRRRASR